MPVETDVQEAEGESGRDAVSTQSQANVGDVMNDETEAIAAVSSGDGESLADGVATTVIDRSLLEQSRSCDAQTNTDVDDYIRQLQITNVSYRR